MKKWTKFAACALTGLLLLAGIAGCSKKPKEIVWGTNAAFMPFEMREGDKVIGIDAEIAQAVADKMGATLKVEDMEFDSLPAALDSGKIDFIAAGYTIKDERLLTMDFSQTYFTAVQVVLVQEGTSDIATADDLAEKKVGVQNGTTGDFTVSDICDPENVSRYDNIMLAAQDLQNGKIDAVVCDDLPAAYLLGSMDGMKKIDSIVFDNEEYAIAVKKGQNAELLKAINDVLSEMKESGKIDELVSKYSLGQ